MKNLILLLFTLASSFLLTACGISSDKKPVSLIFDTDIAPDYDDVGAMAVLHALADQDEVSILATISSNKCWTTIPCLDVINTYYGRPSIPLAVVKGEAADNNTWHKGLRWTEELPKRFKQSSSYKTSADAPDALTLYRKILSEQPDHSVTILTVGFLTNVRNLLLSAPDQYSSLNGKDLIQKKVKKLVCMAGAFPEGREFNVYIDAKSAQTIVNEWPTEILFSGFEIGDKVITGKRLAESSIQNNPIVDVYKMCLEQDDPKGRQSWDQTATLVAVRGAAPCFTEERGTIHVNDDGSNTWQPSADGKHARLIFKMTPQEVTKVIEDLMLHQPKNK